MISSIKSLHPTVPTQGHFHSRIWWKQLAVKAFASTHSRGGWARTGRSSIRKVGLTSSTSSPQMTWKDHGFLWNRAILCIKSAPPLPRPVSSFLIALKFTVGSQSLDGSPVSNSQARYQSGEARVISTISSTFLGWDRKCSRLNS